jgi:hypothetical protein
MRNPVRAASVVATLALAGALLTACTPSAPVRHETKTPAPSPSATPIFASDAEALAAATAAYRNFIGLEDAIGHDGGANPERIRPFVSAAGYQHELQAAKKFIEQGSRGYGNTVLNNTVLESHVEQSGLATVVIYACQDLRRVDVRDSTGKSTIDDSRSDYVVFESRLEGSSEDRLVVQSNTYWAGSDICKF